MANINGSNDSEILTGTISDDSINGIGGDDTLIGDSGNDTLDGGTGNDSLSGGSGNDIYIVDSTGDIVSEDNGSGGDSGGIDTVKSSVDWTLGDYLENLTLTGDQEINGNGNALNNEITGNSASNTLYGGDGNDNIKSLAGDDTIYGEGGNDKLDGGNGNDYLQDSQGNNTLNGGAGDDYLDIYNSSGNNLLDGGDGNDYLYADYSNGNNTLNGGEGNDILSAKIFTGENILLNGGEGNDSLEAYFFYTTESVITTLDSTATNGTISSGNLVINFENIEVFYIVGSDYSDILLGGNGNDIISGGSGNDTISGGAGDDLVALDNTVNSYDESLVDGGSGNDTLSVGFYFGTEGIITALDPTNTNGTITNGSYQINFQNFEAFVISGTRYSDSIVGGNGNDTLNGGYTGSDTIIGGAGDDDLSLWSYAYNSSLLFDGGSGNDTLSIVLTDVSEGFIIDLDATTTDGTITLGGSEQIKFQSIEVFNITGTSYSDSLLGGNGSDFLSGASGGDDTIVGGAGDDTLDQYYSYGNSVLNGGDGNDVLTGSYGVNTFVYSNYTEGIDSIISFDSSQDLIQISANGFAGGLTAGSLSETQFVIGTTATTSAQRFIYDDTTGAIYYDLDGSGNGFNQQQLALLTDVVSLSASNFTIV